MNANSVTRVESHCHCVSSQTAEGNEEVWIEFDFAHTESKELSSCPNSSNPHCVAQIWHIVITEVVDGKKDHCTVKRRSGEQSKKIGCRELRLVDIKSREVMYYLNILVVTHWPENIALAFTFKKVTILLRPDAGFREACLYGSVNVSLFFSLLLYVYWWTF